MQKLARVSTLGTSYDAKAVTDMLLDQQGQERWFFDQYDATLKNKTDFSPYVDFENTSPRITHDSTSAIQRSLTMTLRGDAPLKEINFLSDIIGVRYQLRSPDGGWVEWQLGRFTLTPFDQDIYPGYTWNMLTTPDFGQLLTDATFISSYTVRKNVNYVGAVKAIAQGYGGRTPIFTNIQPSDAILPASRSFDAGETRLSAINKLLASISYFPAWFDEVGVMHSSKIPDYTKVKETFLFDTTSGSSITMIPIQERPDISKVYNQVLVIVEDARKTNNIRMSYLWKNNNPKDPVSLKNWHPKTLTIRTSSIPDKKHMIARAVSEGQAASRVFGKLTAGTFPWPISQNRDVYRWIYSTPDEGFNNFLYVEMKWDMICKTGQMSSHSIERIR